MSSHDAHLAAAAEIETLGFTALWMAGGQLDRLERLTDLLRATRRIVVAPSIIKIGRTKGVFALRAYQPSARRVYQPAALP